MILPFLGDRRGVTAVELAMVLPIFVMLSFGTIEVAFINWRRMILATATEDVADYVRTVRISAGTYSAQDQRALACKILQGANMSCDEATLKIAMYRADNPVSYPIVIPRIIDNTGDVLNGGAGQYVIVLAYASFPLFPTSKILLVNDGSRYQIQVRTFVVAAERVLE